MASESDMLEQLNESVNRRVLLIQHVSMATTVLAYLAFTWSTVVLLGGYVTSLEKKDFYCLTLISLTEATRIFNDMESDKKLMSSVTIFMWNSVHTAVDIAKDCLPIPADSKHGNIGALYLFKKLAILLYTGILMAPVMVVIFSIFVLYLLSPYLFVSLPAWRLQQHDYGVTGGDSSKASLEPALDIFYSLVLVQGALSIFFVVIVCTQGGAFKRFHDICKFPMEWGPSVVLGYIQNTRARSRQNLESVQQASLLSHAWDLVGSEESYPGYITGIRVLGTLAKRGTDVSILSGSSRSKIQKLFWTLGSQESDDLKELAARIIERLAVTIHLAQFPGAARCISTLLEGTDDGGIELIEQGLAILENLVPNHDNCREICSTPGLLRKIMAPVCSGELIQDARIARSRAVRGTFEVLRGLTRVPGEAGRGLRREISCNEQAVTNLESIVLDESNQLCNQDGDEVQILAMEILLELLKDESINLRAETIENIVKKQLKIFLAYKEEGEASAVAVSSPQKSLAGKSLSVLSSNSERKSTIIMREDGDTVASLIKMLDATDIGHKISAMEILRNLCKHCALDKELLNKNLLPKVLQEIFQFSKRDKQRVAPESKNPSTRGDDEEKQNSREKSDSENEEQQLAVKVLQEALLSLSLQLYDLVGVDRFALEVQQAAPGDGAFVEKLKAIVRENCEAKETSLRIVKLCCQIAISMLQRNQYAAHFKELKFVESVSEASEIMSEVESCCLITDTSTGLETLRPFLSELENQLKQELGLVP